MANNLRNITELPVLTEVPDGTYTVVVDGGSAKLAPYGGGEVVEITYTTDDLENFTCNMTCEEIHEALMVNNKMAKITILFLATADTAIPAFSTSLWNFCNSINANTSLSFTFFFTTGVMDDFLKIIHDDANVISADLPSSVAPV